jgi:hypothetical protein
MVLVSQHSAFYLILNVDNFLRFQIHSLTHSHKLSPSVALYIHTGKSTTIAALTGLIETTKGDAEIYGYSLRNDLQDIRSMTGLWSVLNHCSTCCVHILH